MHGILARPARAALPMALAACALLIPGSGALALQLMAAALMARVCALCAGAALRAAAAQVVNDSRLRGNLLTAIIMAVGGGCISSLLCAADISYLPDISLQIAVAGAIINLSQTLCDRLYMSQYKFSPFICDVIIAASAALGAFIYNADLWLMPAAAALPLAAFLVLLPGLRSGTGIRPGFRVLSCAPTALVKSGLFPAFIVYGALRIGDSEAIVPALIGIAILDGLEPPFRRSADEGCAAGIFISLIAAAATICSMILPRPYLPALIAVIASCVGALVTGFRPGIRRMAIIATLSAAAACAAQWITGCISAIPPLSALIAAIALTIAQLALCIPDAIAIRRRLRAKRLQRRRSRI